MKKLLIILLCLFSLNTLTYASFPITENSTSDISNTINVQMDEEEEDEPSLFVQYLLAILSLAILGFGLYFLFRAWWRAWKDDVKGVKILTYIIFTFLLILIIGSLTGGLAGGYA
jgi:formate/nitrite transporter FocA (FNT family)|tara:strand:+ start:361 stop:705 length:345 start_codon:yes stop_codon:yes gene_type:complete